MQINTDQLKRFIVESGLVSNADLDAIEKSAAASGGKLGDALVSAGKIKDSDLRRIEAYVLGIPFVLLKDAKIDPAVLSLIPESIARTNNIIAFKKTGDQLEVAMLDVDDLPTIDFVKKKTGLKIMPSLTDDDSIKAALDPAATDYLYYLHDKNGTIHYAISYADHQANIVKYLD